MRRDNWSVRVETESSMSCDAGNFHIHACVRACEGGQIIHERSWEESIPGDYMQPQSAAVLINYDL